MTSVGNIKVNPNLIVTLFEQDLIKRVRIEEHKSGVYVTGGTPRKYYLLYKFRVYIDNHEQPVLEGEEEVTIVSPMWTSNNTGAELEKKITELKDRLYEIAISKALELLNAREDEIEYDEYGNPCTKEKCIPIIDIDERHFTGLHIYVTEIAKPNENKT